MPPHQFNRAGSVSVSARGASAGVSPLFLLLVVEIEAFWQAPLPRRQRTWRAGEHGRNYGTLEICCNGRGSHRWPLSTVSRLWQDGAHRRMPMCLYTRAVHFSVESAFAGSRRRTMSSVGKRPGGDAAAWPVAAAIRHFRDEFEWHVLNPEECLKRNYGLAHYADPLGIAVS